MNFNTFLERRLNTPTLAEYAKEYKGEKPVMLIVDDFQEFFQEEKMSSDLKSFVSDAGSVMCSFCSWRHTESRHLEETHQHQLL